jgi:chromosome segregation ATPase
MKAPNEDNIESPSSKVKEEGWVEKKKALLKRLSTDTPALKVDRENLAAERKRLVAEVERLENENHALAKRTKALQTGLFEKRATANELFKTSDELMKSLARSLAKKRGLLSEIEFFEAEKATLSNTYLEVSERLGTNVSKIDYTLKDVGFIKGEVRALMDKMELLESEVPMKFQDRDNLDGKIKRTLCGLKGIYDRVQHVESTLKQNYYKNRSE